MMSARTIPPALDHVFSTWDRSDQQMKTWNSSSEDSSEFLTAPSTPVKERSSYLDLALRGKITAWLSATQAATRGASLTPESTSVAGPSAPSNPNTANDVPIDDFSRGSPTHDGLFENFSSAFWLGGGYYTAEPEHMEPEFESESSSESASTTDSEPCSELDRRQRIAALNALSAAPASHSPFNPVGIEGLRERIEHHGRWSPQLAPLLCRRGSSSDSDDDGTDSDDGKPDIIVIGDSSNPGAGAGAEVGERLGMGRGRVGELRAELGLDAPGDEPLERVAVREQRGVRGGRARDGAGDAIHGGELRRAAGRADEARLGQGSRPSAPPHDGRVQRPRQGYSPLRLGDVHETPQVIECPPARGPSRQRQRQRDLECGYDTMRPIVVAPTPRDLVPAFHLTDRGASRSREREQQHFSNADFELMIELGLFPTTWLPPSEHEAPPPPPSRRRRALRLLDAVRWHVRHTRTPQPPTSFSASIDARRRDILPGPAELEYKRDIMTRMFKYVTFDAYRPHDTSPQTVQHVEKAFWDKVDRGEMGITRPECVRSPADMAEFARYLNRVENRIEMYVERGRYDPPPEGSRYEPPIHLRGNRAPNATWTLPRAPSPHPDFVPRPHRSQYPAETDSGDSELEASCSARH